MTEVRTPNLPELKRLNMWVQEQDKLEPGAQIWNQRLWVTQREETPMCQTAYCVAGMAIVRAGHTLSSNPVPLWPEVFIDGEHVGEYTVRDFAAELLGLDCHTADNLFYARNEAFDIDRVIRGIFDEAGVDYDVVEPAPDLEIEIKEAEVADAAKAVRTQLLPVNA